MKHYRQCDLSKGTTRTHGYIEERGAKVGARVEIDGEFWTVDSVADKSITKEELNFMQSSNKWNSLGGKVIRDKL